MNNVIKHLFIINPKSFWNKTKQNQVVAKIHQFFKLMEDENYDIHVSRFPRDAIGFIPLFAKNLPDETILRVYAVGGDGILFDCLNGIMGLPNVELAALPYGHTNNFVRGFGINAKTLFRVLSRQYDAPAISMDVLRCGQHYALNYCVAGLEAEAVRQAEELRGSLKKGNSLSQWLYRGLYTNFYYIGGVAAISRKHVMAQHYEVDIDGIKTDGIYQALSIFNGPYYCGGLHPLLSHTMPNDGVLEMLSMRVRGVLGIVIKFPFYARGYYRMFPRNFTFKQGRKVTIRSDSVFLLCMDGIVFFESEIEIDLLPSAVQFVDAGLHGYRGGRQ